MAGRRVTRLDREVSSRGALDVILNPEIVFSISGSETEGLAFRTKRANQILRSVLHNVYISQRRPG